MKPGTIVTADFRNGWQGELLDEADPRAWAATFAFPGTSLENPPSQEDVNEHLAELRRRYFEPKTTLPVLWDFHAYEKVYWERIEALVEVL